ncbi:hypothetical protein YC2023_077370 [Brassica napus]
MREEFLKKSDERRLLEKSSPLGFVKLVVKSRRMYHFIMNMEKDYGNKKLVEPVIIEEIENGKLDGKLAVQGRKVSIYYTGKLKGSGKLFNSILGEAPLRFRLGKDILDIAEYSLWRKTHKRLLAIYIVMLYFLMYKGNIDRNLGLTDLRVFWIYTFVWQRLMDKSI